MENFHVDHFNFTLPIKSGTSFSILPFEIRTLSILERQFRGEGLPPVPHPLCPRLWPIRRRQAPPFRGMCKATLRVNPEQAQALCQGVEGLIFSRTLRHFPWPFCDAITIVTFFSNRFHRLPYAPIAYCDTTNRMCSIPQTTSLPQVDWLHRGTGGIYSPM